MEFGAAKVRVSGVDAVQMLVREGQARDIHARKVAVGEGALWEEECLSACLGRSRAPFNPPKARRAACVSRDKPGEVCRGAVDDLARSNKVDRGRPERSCALQKVSRRWRVLGRVRILMENIERLGTLVRRERAPDPVIVTALLAAHIEHERRLLCGDQLQQATLVDTRHLLAERRALELRDKRFVALRLICAPNI